MFRQIAPNGIVNKEAKTGTQQPSDRMPKSSAADDDDDDHSAAAETDEHNEPDGSTTSPPKPEDAAQKKSIYTSSVTGAEEPSSRGIKTEQDVPEAVDGVDRFLEHPADHVHPHPKDAEMAVRPKPGDAVAAPAGSEETKVTHEEMSKISPMECPFLMNRE